MLCRPGLVCGARVVRCAFAGFGGNDNTAVADASYTREFAGVYGNNNHASLVGPENSFAVAFDGTSNVAIVDDPVGTAASYADFGYGFNSDVAEVLGTHGTTAAVSADDLYDVLTALGPEAGSF